MNCEETRFEPAKSTFSLGNWEFYRLRKSTSNSKFVEFEMRAQGHLADAFADDPDEDVQKGHVGHHHVDHEKREKRLANSDYV